MTPYHEMTWSQQLDYIAALEDDWDSYGDPAPGLAHANELRAVIGAALERFGALPFHIAPYSLEWQGERGSLEMTVPAGDGGYNYLLIPDRRDDGLPWHEGHADLAGILDALETVLP